MKEDISFTFDKIKSLETINFIANRVEKSDFHKVFKILYFAEMEHLVKFGKPITGDTFIAMQNGPVPSKIYDILKSINTNNFLIDKDAIHYFEVFNKNLIKPKIKDVSKNLSKSEVEVLENSIKSNGNLNFEELVEKSHGRAWLNTEANKRIAILDIIKEGIEKNNLKDLLEYIKEEQELDNIFK